MESRTLGKNGLVVSAMGLGCMGMSEFYGATNEAEALDTLDRALELGITFLDTADMYGVGRNEELIGRAIAGRRSRIVLATKFGNVRGPDGSFLGVNGRPEYVRAACEARTSFPSRGPSASPTWRRTRARWRCASRPPSAPRWRRCWLRARPRARAILRPR
jgi:hypothetical protein